MVTLEPSAPGKAPPTTRPRRLRARPLAAAAALAFLALTTLWLTRDGERYGLPRTYSTAHGEQIERPLPDGSLLHLNTDSKVTVRYSRRERVVELDRGEALFKVAHDNAQRGFRVAAGNAQVLDVGTQFDIYLKPGAVLVTVVEGIVAVYAGRAVAYADLAAGGRRLPSRGARPGGFAAAGGCARRRCLAQATDCVR